MPHEIESRFMFLAVQLKRSPYHSMIVFQMALFIRMLFNRLISHITSNVSTVEHLIFSLFWCVPLSKRKCVWVSVDNMHINISQKIVCLTRFAAFFSFAFYSLWFNNNNKWNSSRKMKFISLFSGWGRVYSISICALARVCWNSHFIRRSVLYNWVCRY